MNIMLNNCSVAEFSNPFVEILQPIYAQQINNGPTQHLQHKWWKLSGEWGMKGVAERSPCNKTRRKPVKKRCFTRKQSRSNVHKRCFNYTVLMWRWVTEMHYFVFFAVHSSNVKFIRYLSLNSPYTTACLFSL